MKVVDANPKFEMLVNYLMELPLQNYDFLKFLPSKIAASAIYLALSMLSDKPGKPEWTSLLKSHTDYSEEDLRDCVRCLHALTGQNPPGKYRAVRKKYSAMKFLKVAKIP